MPGRGYAEVISIGDELLIGQVINTNQAYIAKQINSVGIDVARMVTVGDKPDEILGAFREGAGRASIVTVTGGLGPTHDDVTRSAVCTYLGAGLVLHPPTLRQIETIFSHRNMPVTSLNKDQANVPEGVDVILNALGTAPGYRFTDEGATFFVMPGVPYEMHRMMEDWVVPYLRDHHSGGVIVHRTILTTGIAESILAEKLGDTEELLLHQKELSLAYLPSPTGVRLRITARGTDRRALERAVSTAESRILERGGKFVYGYDDENLETVLGRILVERRLSIAVAESCTGGLIVDRLTDVPGSSAYVERGFVCYSDDSKTEELGVPAELVSTHGAVSAEVARAMAEGVRKTSGTDVGLSTTGIAGPGGGSPEKPVGLVFVGYADSDGSLALRFVFGNDRRRIKERAAQAALELLRKRLSAS